MKPTTLTLLTTAGIIVTAFTSISCNNTDSANADYKAWKNNGSGQPANNPYGVPQASGETGTYTPSGTAGTPRAQGGSAPYQPLPGVNAAPSPQPPLASDPRPPASSSNYRPQVPSMGGASHTVQAGDSLWALARKHNTSVEAIQSANGMSSTSIRIGQTLTIPAQ